MKMNTIRLAIALLGLTITIAAMSSKHGLAIMQRSSELNGTSWQLVKFQGPDERTFAPDDKSKYTITFRSDGRVLVRVDCNRGSSSWRATEKGELQFGSWSRTSAKCGSGSLHDQIVREGAAVNRFAIKDGHLFLSGMAAGGYYELEPLPTQKRQ